MDRIRHAPGRHSRHLVVAAEVVLPELAEAAVRGGDMEVAHGVLEKLIATTAPFDSNVARGIEARSRALLSTGADAEGLYREAIERLGRRLVRPELARAPGVR